MAVDIQTLEHRLTSLEVERKRTDEHLRTHDRAIEKMDGELKEIVKLLSSRPTWFVTGVITILATVTSSLIVYVVVGHH